MPFFWSLKERPNNVKNGCSGSTDDSELNTTPDGQVLQVLLSPTKTFINVEYLQPDIWGGSVWFGYMRNKSVYVFPQFKNYNICLSSNRSALWQTLILFLCLSTLKVVASREKGESQKWYVHEEIDV